MGLNSGMLLLPLVFILLHGFLGAPWLQVV
jgi:hypothetical protein